MRRGTLFIFLFILIVAGVLGASFFLRSQPPLDIRIAVSPLAEAWVRDAAAAYNATEPVVNTTRRVQVSVEVLEDASLWLSDNPAQFNQNPPDAWIPAAVFSLRYAQEQRYPLTALRNSLAQTPLIWGGFNDSVEVVSGDAPLDWAALTDYATDNRITLAFYNPTSSVLGISALLSGAAARANTATISASEFNSAAFREWMQPVLQSVPSFNTFGSSVAQTLATRGRSVGEIALLPESEWLVNAGRGQFANSLLLSYPAYTLVFDLPFATWSQPATEAADPVDRDAALNAFANFLLSAAQQTNAQRFGLRPADATVLPTGNLFTSAVLYGAQTEPLYIPVEIPTASRNDLLQLQSWAETTIR